MQFGSNWVSGFACRCQECLYYRHIVSVYYGRKGAAPADEVWFSVSLCTYASTYMLYSQSGKSHIDTDIWNNLLIEAIYTFNML